jgi:hypothetical protein
MELFLTRRDRPEGYFACSSSRYDADTLTLYAVRGRLGEMHLVIDAG